MPTYIEGGLRNEEVGRSGACAIDLGAQIVPAGCLPFMYWKASTHALYAFLGLATMV